MDFSLFSSPDDIVLCDAGVETTLYYKQGFPLRHQAGFEALYSDKYRAHLESELLQFAQQAANVGRNVALDTITYRASKNFYDLCDTPVSERGDGVSSKATALVKGVRSKIAERTDSGTKVFVAGCIGSLGDGYSPETCPTPEEAHQYHKEQIECLARAGTDYISAYTLTSSAEAIGVARACRDAKMPCTVSFTLESDGKLALGESLGEAILKVDSSLKGDESVMFFGVNCIHPTLMRAVLDEGRASQAPWVERIKSFKANSSSKSHEELEKSTELDEGNPDEWAREMESLRADYPGIQLVGGCCGTGVVHQSKLAQLVPKKM